MFQTKFVDEIKTQILCWITSFFLMSFRFWDNMGKYSTAGQATDENMAHAHCMLDTKVYKHTHRTCNTCSFSTVTMVTRSRLQCDVICTLPVLCTFICCHCCIRLWVTEEFRSNLSHIRPRLCANRTLFQHLAIVCRVAVNWCCKTNKSESL
jgi:hypothetical protein